MSLENIDTVLRTYKVCTTILSKTIWILKIKNKMASQYNSEIYLNLDGIDVILQYDYKCLYKINIIQCVENTIYYLGSITCEDKIGSLDIYNFDTSRKLLGGKLNMGYLRSENLIKKLIFLCGRYTSIKQLLLYDISNLNGIDLILVRTLAGIGSMYLKYGFQPLSDDEIKDEKYIEYKGIIINRENANERWYFKNYRPDIWPTDINDFVDECKKFYKRETDINYFKEIYDIFHEKYNWYFSRTYSVNIR